MTFEEHKIAYWKAVDWTKPRSEIMAETGCSIGCIMQWYSRVFGGTVPRVIKNTETLEALDWSKSDSQLARETRISGGSIRSYRFTHRKGLPTKVPQTQGVTVTLEQIEAAEWELESDMSLALKWGVSRERVRQIRQEQNKKMCLLVHRPHDCSDAAKWLSANRSQIEGKHITEIIGAVPTTLSRHSIKRLVDTLGIKYTSGRNWKYSSNGKYPINYDLPNIVIGLIWGVAHYSLANVRCQLKVGKGKWQAGGRFSRFWEKPDFREALEQELIKAETHGKTEARSKIEEYLNSKRIMANGKHEQQHESEIQTNHAEAAVEAIQSLPAP